jgi:hypothetical protein
MKCSTLPLAFGVQGLVPTCLRAVRRMPAQHHRHRPLSTKRRQPGILA